MKKTSAIFLLCVLHFPGFFVSGWVSAQSDSSINDSFRTNPKNRNLNSITQRDSIVNHQQIIKSGQFYDSLRTRNYRNKWMRELSNIMILPPDSSKKIDQLDTESSVVDFVQYKGLIIRSIRFVKLDVFGPNILDTTITDDKWLARTANKIHFKTSDKLLERHLLIKIGDIIDPRILSDNERLIRELAFIEDVRFSVNLPEGIDGYADVTIITKDRWSKAFYLDLSGFNTGKLQLWDRNIFGSGNEIQYNIHYNPEKAKSWGHEAIFTNRNIYGSFIDGKVEYRNVYETELYGISFERKFFTPDTKYAGSASAYHISTLQTIVYSEISRTQVPVDYNIMDFWIGRAIPLNKGADVDKSRINLIAASKVYKESHFARPSVTPNSFYKYHNKTVWLNTLALSSQSFFTSSLIYNYGKTEDIPIGYLANFTFGPEFGEFKKRFYTSLSLSRGFYFPAVGYLYAQFSEGGFYNNINGFEQGLVQARFKYFTNLFIIGRFKYRQFIDINYTQGIKRYTYESINLNDPEGIRGFSNASVYGNHKIVLNLETVAFTPYYVAGFRFVGFGFFDLGRIAQENKPILKEDLYTGLGLGVRIRNERLVFPTFELRFAYYPNLPRLIFDEYFRFSGVKKVNFDNFYLKNPAILDYR